MQVTLTFESPDPSGLQVKLIDDRLGYRNVQDGVDIEFYVNSRENLEYDLFVKKQVVLENLHFRLSGCEIFQTDQSLCWNIPHFTALETVLSVFQQEDRMPVPYRLTLDSANEYHYSIDYPDSVKFPIVVDPEIEFSTYIGEEDPVSLEAVVQDASGAIYTCGSIQLPVLSPEDGSQTGTEKTNTDTILLRMDPKGETIYQSIIVGGEDGDELPVEIQLSVNEAVYIAGTTTSKDFPVSWNAVQERYQGFGDAFCFVMNSQTEEILFSSYWGGSKSDNLTSLAVLQNGNVVLGGNTNSQDFPLKRPVQGSIQGLFDGFLSVIAIEKKQMEFSTFLGGMNQDSIECIAIQKDGSLIVAGSTQSPDFFTSGGEENDYQGGLDIFVTSYTPSFVVAGSNLFGGNNHDFPGDIVCNQEKTFLIGTTLSEDFPLTTEPSYIGHDTNDIFQGGDIVLMAFQETHLLQACLFGGTGDDIGVSIAVDEKQQVYITGNTRSMDLPVTHNATKKILTDWIDRTSGMEGVIARFDHFLQKITYCSYWGGRSDDSVHDGSLYQNKITLVGVTNSENFPTTMPSLKIEKTKAIESFISSIQIDYFAPSVPEELMIIQEEGDIKLKWSPSLPGEAPIQGYGVRFQEYGIKAPGLLRGEQRMLQGEDVLEYSLSLIGIEDDCNYYFYVFAYDENNQPSLRSKEVSLVHQKKELPIFLLAECYDSNDSPDHAAELLEYFKSLEQPQLTVLHYYPNKHPSQAIKSRSRLYDLCRQNWCMVNGSTFLTMQDKLEDTVRLMQMQARKPNFSITWQKLSVPNDETDQEVKISLKKVGPYPRLVLASTVLLVQKIADNHWEVIESAKNLWNAPHFLFGEDSTHFTFYYHDMPDIRFLENVQEYSLVVLLQDPIDKEVLANAFIPLAQDEKEATP